MSWLERSAWVSVWTLLPALAGGATAQWEFSGDLNPSAGTSPLVAEAAGPAAAPEVTFATAAIGGHLARVASFSRGTYFRLAHGLAPNGGGALVNQYTLIVDVMFPDRSPSGGWASLWQTSGSNADDGDWFVRPDGGVGISGTYGGSVPDGAWHRLALVVDLAAGTHTGFVDGVQASQRTAEALDGRHSLGPDALLFADQDGENAAGLVNSLRVVDRALTAAEVQALGGPTAAGIGAYFADDFEPYGTDADLLAAGWQIVQAGNPVEVGAAWTVTNPGGRRNPPTENGTPSTGKFVVSDSDWHDPGSNTAGSGMSHDLVTPGFSTAGAAKVWLHADLTAQLNNGGDAVFDVDVSVDGGASWTNAFRRVSPGGRAFPPTPDTGNADGFFGRLHLDLTVPAAGRPAVHLRFRHFEPTDDWWIAIDDLLVDGQAPPQGGKCDVLAAQDFSAGLGSMKAVSLAFPPNSGTETWHTTDKGHRYTPGSATGSSGRAVSRLNHPGPTPDFAILDSDADPDPAEDEYLMTPVLNCFSFDAVFLHFKSETVMDEEMTQEVLLSTDGGATFPVRIFSYNQAGGPANAGFDGGEDPVYGDFVFSVPQAVGQARVVFAFHLKSPGDRWYWAVDDVKVSADIDGPCDTRPCGLRNFAAVFDPETNSVQGSWKLLPGDEGFQVFEGNRQIGGTFPADAASFTDASPPASGEGVVYMLKPLLGGVVERECAAPAIDTFRCPAGFQARPDQKAKTVKLSWTPAANVSAVAYYLFRDAEQIATLDLAQEEYMDTPRLASTTDFSVFAYQLVVYSDPGGNPCSALSARAIVSPGTVCFAEDFEDYADDVDLEFADWFRVDVVPDAVARPGEAATWTVTNPGQRGNPPAFDGRASAGRFAISDSDFAGGDNGAPGSGNSNDLWSPAFACTNLERVWLHMDVSAQLNNNGKVVFDIDLSTDSGINWTNVYRRVAPARTEAQPVADNGNAGGYFGRLDVDLTTLARGKPNVRFRLRSFEPSDDWWVAVDNVIVDDLPPLQGGRITLLERQEFNGDLGEMTPESRATPPNAGTETWHVGDKGRRYVPGTTTGFDGRSVSRLAHPEPAPNFAILDSGADPDPAEDEYLVTPVLDCTRMAEVFLHWASEIVAVSGAVQEVLLSVDGGTSFEPEPVFSYNGGGLFDPGEEPFFARRVLRVPRAAGEPGVVFAFHYKSPGNQQWWAIDDVSVTGNPLPPQKPCAIAGLAHELRAEGVALSWSVDTDTDDDGVADCACTKVTVQTDPPGASPPRDLPGDAVSFLVPGTCAEIFAAGGGRLCVSCIGPDGTEKRACTASIACGGLLLPGDCNADGNLDISDGICSLGYLFLGAPVRLPCGDGAGAHRANLDLLDWNRDGRLDVSDPVAYLSWRFVGSGPPHPLGTACARIADCPDACRP